MALASLLINLSVFAGVPYVPQFNNGSVPGPNFFTNGLNKFTGDAGGLTNQVTLDIVKDFGAVSGSPNDQSTSFQVAANSGFRVKVTGVFTITNNVYMTNNSRFVGDNGTISAGSAFTNFLFSMGTSLASDAGLITNCYLDGLKFIGPDNGQFGSQGTRSAIFACVGGGTGSYVRNCEISGFNGYGILALAPNGLDMVGNNSGIEIADNTVKNCFLGIVLNDNLHFPRTCEYITIKGNIVYNCTTNLIVDGGNNAIVGNIFRNPTLWNAYWGTGANNAHGLASGNFFNHGASSSAGSIWVENTTSGMLFTGNQISAGGAIVINNAVGVNFIGNRFSQTFNLSLTSNAGGKTGQNYFGWNTYTGLWNPPDATNATTHEGFALLVTNSDGSLFSKDNHSESMMWDTDQSIHSQRGLDTQNGDSIGAVTTGDVGYSFLCNSNIVVTALARMTRNANSQVHTLKLKFGTNDCTVLSSGTVNLAGTTVGQWQYVPLTNPVALTAGFTYAVTSSEVNGGDVFLLAGNVTNAPDITPLFGIAGNTTCQGFSGWGGQTLGPVKFVYYRVGQGGTIGTGGTPGIYNATNQAHSVANGSLFLTSAGNFYKTNNALKPLGP